MAKKFASVPRMLFCVVCFFVVTAFFSGVPAVAELQMAADGDVCRIVGGASYPTLEAAINSVTSGSATIEMLSDYTMTGSATVRPGAAITLTTASDYVGTATVMRGYDGKALITVQQSGSLVLDKIVLDGNKDSFTTGESGGLVRAEGSSSLTVNAGATLRNSKSAVNGGAIMVATGASLTMNGGLIAGNETYADAPVQNNDGTSASSFGGGGIYVGGRLEMHGGEIRDNTVQVGGASLEAQGGGVIVMPGGVFTMDGGAIADNQARGDESAQSFRTKGGGVYVGGSFTLSGGVVSDNTAARGGSNPANGGGVYVASGGSFTQDGGSVRENTADNGGGVYADGMVTLREGTPGADGAISQNVATNFGGGVYLSSTSSFSMASGEIDGNAALRGAGVYASSAGATISGGKVSRNVVSSDGVGGAGIWVAADLALSGDAVVSENEAPGGQGGGVYVGGGTLTISGDAQVLRNSARLGGAVYTNSSGTVVMNGGSLANNSATSDGGAVYANKTFTMTGGEITGNSSDRGAVYVGGKGVRLYFSGSPVVHNNPQADGQQMNVYLGVESDDAVNSGNGIVNSAGLNDDAYIGIYTPAGSMRLNHGLCGKPFGTFTSDQGLDRFFNDADGTGLVYGVSKDAGTICWKTYVCKITDENHQALRRDGKVAVYDDLPTAFAEFSSKTFKQADGTTATPAHIEMLLDSYAIGSAEESVTLNYAKPVILTTASLEDDEFPGPYTGTGTECVVSRAFNGVSLFTVNANLLANDVANLSLVRITLDGDRIEGSYLSGEDGGLVYVKNGKLAIGEGATLRNSATAYYGGAIFLADKARLEMTAGTVSGNTARAGGGIFIAGNSANNNNQNRDSDPATFTISSARIEGNSATAWGGGLLVSQGAVVKITNTRMVDNKALGTMKEKPSRLLDYSDYEYGSGGAIFADRKTTLYLSNCTIGEQGHPNTAASDEMSSSLRRPVGGSGGGLYLYNANTWQSWAAAKAYLDDCTVQYNEAVYGGGISTQRNSSLFVTNTIISNNTASYSGGGIYTWDGDGFLNMQTVTVQYNTAVYEGGGIWSGGTNAAQNVLTDVSIAQNRATTGGGIYAKRIAFCNTQVTNNWTTSADEEGPRIDAAAGMYLTNQLVINDDNETEGMNPTSISGNKTAVMRQVPSDLHLPYSNKVNNADSIELESSFRGKIYVTNPGRLNSKFGDAAEDSDAAYQDYPNVRDWEKANIVSENDSQFYGRRLDGGGLYWYQESICKLTSDDRDLLYLKDGNEYREAVFIYLFDGTSNDDTGTTESAVGVLNRNDGLYRKVGDDFQEYTGTAVHIEMLTDYGINIPVRIKTDGTRQFILTTALPVGSSGLKDDYGYRIEGKETALLYPGSSMGALKRDGQEDFMFRILNKTKLEIRNITLDGGAKFVADENDPTKVKFDGYKPVYTADSFISKKDGFLVQITNASTLTLGAGATLQNVYTTHMYGGGAICFGQSAANAYLYMLDGSKIYRCFSGFSDNPSSQNDLGACGGAIGFTKTAGTYSDTVVIRGGIIEQCWSEEKGGAIYVPNNSHTLRLEGGTFIDCAAPYGGAIYLDDKGSGGNYTAEVSATLSMQGALVFGGNYATATEYASYYQGADSEANRKNGEDLNAYEGGVRQDIFVKNFKKSRPTDPARAITITGALTGERGGAPVPGSIWLWIEQTPAEGHHHQNEDQFAVVDASLHDQVTEESFYAFRNARDDATTNNDTGSYLTGVIKDPYDDRVYWGPAPVSTGAARVILRKVAPTASGTYAPLLGARFRLYKAGWSELNKDAVYESDSSGVYFVGSLDYGTYYLVETNFPDGYGPQVAYDPGDTSTWAYYTLTVAEDGVTLSDTYSFRT